MGTPHFANPQFSTISRAPLFDEEGLSPPNTNVSQTQSSFYLTHLDSVEGVCKNQIHGLKTLRTIPTFL